MEQHFEVRNSRTASYRECFYVTREKLPSDHQIVVKAYGESEVFNERISIRTREMENLWIEEVLQGVGTLEFTDGSRHHLEPGNIYLLAPRLGSSISVKQGVCFRKRVISFRNGLLLRVMLRGTVLSPERIARLPDGCAFSEILTRIGTMIKTSPAADFESLSTEAYRLLLSLHYQPVTSKSEEPLSFLFDFMRSKLNAALTLNDLADAAGCSPATLIRKFRIHCKCTPMQYLIGLRLDCARDLLLDKNLSVRETAELCGYSDPKFFSRSFRRKFGVPPSEIRKSPESFKKP